MMQAKSAAPRVLREAPILLSESSLLKRHRKRLPIDLDGQTLDQRGQPCRQPHHAVLDARLANLPPSSRLANRHRAETARGTASTSRASAARGTRTLMVPVTISMAAERRSCAALLGGADSTGTIGVLGSRQHLEKLLANHSRRTARRRMWTASSIVRPDALH